MNVSLPDYDLQEEIGRGGMSVVHKARHKPLNRTVAIKILRMSLSQEAEEQDRFQREIQLTAKINHPNLVQVYDAGQYNGTPYYIMEYITGPTLGEILQKRGTLQEEDVLRIAQDIAHALKTCWDKHHLTHCDLKPDNIMLDLQGNTKIADLGIARIVDMGQPDASEYVHGTPAYMSPEQITGEPDIDFRSDIYSLGAMLYELLTGKSLFHDQPQDQKPDLHLQGQSADIIDHDEGLQPATAWLLEKMLIKDPNFRHSSWDEVIHDIEAAQHGYLIATGIPESPSTLHRSPLRGIPPKVPAGLKKDLNSRKKTPALRGVQDAAALSREHRRKSTITPGLDLQKALIGLLCILIINLVLYGYTYIQTQLSNATPAAQLAIQPPPQNLSIIEPEPQPAPEPEPELPPEPETTPPVPPAPQETPSEEPTEPPPQTDPEPETTPEAGTDQGLEKITQNIAQLEEQFNQWRNNQGDQETLASLSDQVTSLLDTVSPKVHEKGEKEYLDPLRRLQRLMAAIRWSQTLSE